MSIAFAAAIIAAAGIETSWNGGKGDAPIAQYTSCKYDGTHHTHTYCSLVATIYLT